MSLQFTISDALKTALRAEIRAAVFSGCLVQKISRMRWQTFNRAINKEEREALKKTAKEEEQFYVNGFSKIDEQYEEAIKRISKQGIIGPSFYPNLSR